jgi:glutaredoxin-dependent peroxiredoxin
VIGISVDSPYAHDAWRMTLDIPEELILLSDFNREFGDAYGLAHTTASGYRGVLRRAVFVIDRDGTVVYRWDNTDPPSLPKVDDVLPAVRALQP